MVNGDMNIDNSRDKNTVTSGRDMSGVAAGRGASVKQSTESIRKKTHGRRSWALAVFSVGLLCAIVSVVWACAGGGVPDKACGVLRVILSFTLPALFVVFGGKLKANVAMEIPGGDLTVDAVGYSAFAIVILVVLTKLGIP